MVTMACCSYHRASPLGGAQTKTLVMVRVQVGQLKSVPKRVRLSKHGTIMLVSNFFMHIYWVKLEESANTIIKNLQCSVFELSLVIDFRNFAVKPRIK